MGSTGSGNFSDYKQSQPKNNQGGESGEDKCGKAFSSKLEEVQNCQYYDNHDDVPPLETVVIIAFNGQRLTVVDVNTNEEIGYLPTKFNFLKVCLDDGFNFTGVVSASSTEPFPSVSVDISPNE